MKKTWFVILISNHKLDDLMILFASKSYQNHFVLSQLIETQWHLIETAVVMRLLSVLSKFSHFNLDHPLCNYLILSYLSDTNTSIQHLDHYHIIRKLFIRFNTAIPSSAAVERLFSIAGLIETPRRNRLSDVMFEKLTLIKLNQGTFNLG